MLCQKTKYWEIIADNLSKRGWSLGCVSFIDGEGRTIHVPMPSVAKFSDYSEIDKERTCHHHAPVE